MNTKEREYIINWKLLLVNYYKNLYLQENEVMVILMIDLCLQRNITFVSPDMLALKMNYSVQEIDKVYASLSSRGYVVNKNEGGKLITSLDGIKDVLMSQFIMENSKKVISNNDDSNSIYSLFENEFGRALTPFEIDTIRDWIESGFSIDLVKSALNEAVRNKVRSIKYVDRVLLNYRQQEEIKKEGNTTISEKWRKDIDETMNIAKTRWVKEND